MTVGMGVLPGDSGDGYVLFDFVRCISRSIDMVSPAVADHHMRVAYIASCIGEEVGLHGPDICGLVIAGALHDIGAFSLRERLMTLKFDIESPREHAETGYVLLKGFRPLSKAALLIRHHHAPWREKYTGSIPIGSHILNLADRADILINRGREILGQRRWVRDTIREHSGRFMPDAVDAFMELSQRESFWLDISYPDLASVTEKKIYSTIHLDLDGLERFASIMSYIIDFRSPFTATHSRGVAACAWALSKFMGFQVRDSRLIRVAGYLHDLGKLAISPNVLEKPSALARSERDIILKHAFYTYRTLETVRGFDTINEWASFHHERPDGRGYPFRLGKDDLPLGSRIVAVSDVFTALAEDRPYRGRLSRDESMRIIQDMAREGALDPDVVAELRRNFDEVDHIRKGAQSSAYRDYRRFGGMF